MTEASATAGPSVLTSPQSTRQVPNGSSLASGTSGTSLPPISLPSGGGSIRGMGDNFSTNAFNGTGAWSVPVTVSESRQGAHPELSLQYSTGGGNSPFGLGWSLDGIPSITRKTALGLPKYRDEEDSDIFLISGAEDLVPMYRQDKLGGTYLKDKNGRYISDETSHDGFIIRRYRPRIEGAFARLERWTDLKNPQEVHWRLVSPQNKTSVFGRDSSSRIESVDISSGRTKIFSWLLCEWFDCVGNGRRYEYKAEDGRGVDTTRASEANRSPDALGSQRYLKRVKYGNRTPITRSEPVSLHTDWMFEVVFDFGEHSLLDPKPQEDSSLVWACRKDPFSSYKSTFERELGLQDYLVNSLDLTYREDPAITFLRQVQHASYALPSVGDTPPSKSQGPYLIQRLPPLEFSYTTLPTNDQLQKLIAQPISDKQDVCTWAGIKPNDRKSLQWVDLLCEGITGMLIQEGKEWYYKRNLSPRALLNKVKSDSQDALGDVVSSSTPKLAPKQLLTNTPSVQSKSGSGPNFSDLNGSGQLDQVILQGPVTGFYKSIMTADNTLPTGEEIWLPFQPFPSLPSIDFNDPNLRFLDLTGDGKADILITQDDLFVWYESVGEAGYAPTAGTVLLAAKEDLGPRVLFSDPTESIHLADFSGDGLVDIVRIKNSEVCYWPNMGYGKFGPKVRMENAPVFDSDDQFSPRRLLLGDTDGSGTTDILYFQGSVAYVFLNLAGNSFSSRLALSSLFPSFDSLTTVTAVDLLGNGTMCLVWASSHPANNGEYAMQYVDLMNGVKPHLLTRAINNLGSETRIFYCPSTAYYLQDQHEGRPWATSLPFPQHCVDRVITYDHISGTKYTSRYRYHHGHFDPVEREFRGFGMVEEWDTEQFESLSAPTDATNLNQETYLPPAHTKTWFHLGAFTDHERLSRIFANEYFHPSKSDSETFFRHQLRDWLPENSLNLTIEECRQASRALKGSILRVEIYTDDDTGKANLPYQIQDHGNSVRRVQPMGDCNPYAVFYPFTREVVTCHYERQLSDPRIQHTLVLEVDAFGNPLKDVSVSYGRLKNDDSLSAQDQGIQRKTQILYTEDKYTNEIDVQQGVWTDDYRTPMACERKLYELLNYEVGSDTDEFTPASFVDVDKVPEIGYDQPVEGNLHQKRILRCTETVFRQNDLTSLSKPGELQSLALPGQTYVLQMTPATLSLLRRDGEILLPDPSSVLGEGGYLDLKQDKSWWTHTPNIFYDSRPDISPAEELKTAQASFFLPFRVLNQYGNSTIYHYDSNLLKPIQWIDALQNTVSGEVDYRVLGMQKLTDANGNRSQCAFDVLGNVVGVALMGKVGEDVGDSLDQFRPNLTEDEIDTYFKDPNKSGQTLLAGASSRFIYDVNSYWKRRSNGPTRFSEISRETHLDAEGGVPSRVLISISFTDGQGRIMQHKACAEPSAKSPVTERWRCSGWTILNNKGSVVQEFEPFFTDVPDFENDVRVGVSPVHLYDPLNRRIGSVLPNKSWIKQSIAVWHIESWDANDTVALSPSDDLDAGPSVRRLPASLYTPTWYEARKDGQMGLLEQKTAAKALLHANTPSTSYMDAAGRKFLQVNQNLGGKRLPARTVFDSDGSVLEVQDSESRTVTRNIYHMTGGTINTMSMDQGLRWMLMTATGEPLIRWDARGNRFRSEYDALRRPTNLFCENTVQKVAEYVVSKIEYGESLTYPEPSNLRGKKYQVSDQSGISIYPQWDFKGNLLIAERQLAKDYKANVDWSASAHVVLEDVRYISQTSYDARNRVVTATLPDKSVIQNTFNEGGLLQTLNCNPRGEQDPGGGATWIPIVSSCEYDAYGRTVDRLAGNGARTIKTYDPLTFRLNKDRVKVDNSTVQDFDYTYDPVGNVTFLLNHAEQTVFFRNVPVEPHAEYTYDAIYRLIEATGREHVGQTKGKSPGPENGPGIAIDAPGDGRAMARYTESYTYDDCNNMIMFQHGIADPQYGGWTRRMVYQEPSAIEDGKFNNRLSASAVGSRTERYTFDAHGNTISMPQLSQIQWDCFDMIRSLSRQNVNQGTPEKTWYTYDARGTRTRKVTERQRIGDNGADRKLSERIYVGDFDIYREYNGNGDVAKECQTVHVTNEDNTLALIEHWSGKDNKAPARLVRFQVHNHCDSVTIELDDQGKAISYEEFTPYGSTSYQSLLVQDAPKRYRFSNKEKDKESGLNYYGYRYYIPWIGRWMSVDPAGIGAGLNVYVYVRCNPVSRIDPDGGMDRQIGGVQDEGGGDDEEEWEDAGPGTTSSPWAPPPSTPASAVSSSSPRGPASSTSSRRSSSSSVSAALSSLSRLPPPTGLASGTSSSSSSSSSVIAPLLSSRLPPPRGLASSTSSLSSSSSSVSAALSSLSRLPPPRGLASGTSSSSSSSSSVIAPLPSLSSLHGPGVLPLSNLPSPPSSPSPPGSPVEYPSPPSDAFPTPPPSPTWAMLEQLRRLTQESSLRHEGHGAINPLLTEFQPPAWVTRPPTAPPYGRTSAPRRYTSLSYRGSSYHPRRRRTGTEPQPENIHSNSGGGLSRRVYPPHR